MTKTSKVIDTTKKNVKRNRWLSFATIFVSTIVLAITSFFVSVAILGRVAVKYYEQRAQVIVFFKQETPEADILSFRDKIYDPTLIADIQYLSQEDALAVYKEDFADNPDLISTVTADSLPPSLEIRAYDIDGLLQIIKNVNTEKETNPNIDEIMYFEDVDYCLSTNQRGQKIILDPSVCVSHNTSSSFSRPTDKLKISFRSHLRFISKWLHGCQKLIPFLYAIFLYPYLYVLWTYHFYKSNR